MKKLGVVFLLLLLLAAGCSRDTYTAIPLDKDFVASVNIKDGSITFIDGESMKEMAEWIIHEPISGAMLLPDQNHLVIYGKEMSSVLVYSLSEGKLADEWKVGKGIVAITAINGEQELALVDQSTDSIRIFSSKGKELRSKRVGNQPISISEDQNAKQLYVVNFNDDKITVIDSNTLKTTKEININMFSAGIMIRSPEQEVWVGGHGEGEEVEENVHIYSTVSGKLLNTIRTPSMPIGFLSFNNDVYIVSHGTNTVYKYTDQHELIALQVGVNPFEMKHMKDKLIIAAYDSDNLHIVDPDRFAVEKTVAVGKGPFQLVVRE